MNVNDDFSKQIVLFVIFLAIVFTVAVLAVFVKTGGNEPTVLVGSVFAFLTGELWQLAKIKIHKNKRGDNDDVSKIDK